MTRRICFGLSLVCVLATGSAYAISSGAANMAAAVGKTIDKEREVASVKELPETWEEIHEGTRHCKSAPKTEKVVRNLTHAPLLSRNAQIWPGNILQGKYFAQGEWTPITIRRSGGILQITGADLKDSKASNEVKVARMSAPNVAQSSRSLVSRAIAGKESNKSLTIKTVYSDDQIAFDLGVDGRFIDSNLQSLLRVDAKNVNRVLARYQEVFYTISFQDPEDAFDVFEKGDKFADSENQVGATNPPLYVKQVDYGRVLYVMVSSAEPAKNIEAAVESIWNPKEGEDDSDKDNVKKVMANASVAYYAMGGDAASGVQPIRASSPEIMLTEVKKVISKATAPYENLSQGLPIGYSLNYLLNKEPVSLTYATAYDQRECTLIPRRYYSFAIENTCIEDTVELSVTDQKGDEQPIATLKKASDGYTNLDKLIPAENATVTLKILESNLTEKGCNDFKFSRTYQDPKTDKIETVYLQSEGGFGPEEHEFKTVGKASVTKSSDIRIILNRETGVAQFTRR